MRISAITKEYYKSTQGTKIQASRAPKRDPKFQPGDLVRVFVGPSPGVKPIVAVRWDETQQFWRVYLVGLSAPENSVCRA